MKFICLDAAISAVADRLRQSRTRDEVEDLFERESQAAADLHQAMCNAEAAPPRWVKINAITRRAVFADDEIKGEGLAMLECVGGWAERRALERRDLGRDRRACERAGHDPSLVLDGHDLFKGKYARDKIWREREIGFDETELVRFLESCRIPHALTSSAPNVAVESTEHRPKTSTSKPDEAEGRQVKWRRALGELLPAIFKDTGKHDVTTVVRELKKRGKKYGISQDEGDTGLVWMDDYGNKHTVTRGTVNNALCDARKLLSTGRQGVSEAA